MLLLVFWRGGCIMCSVAIVANVVANAVDVYSVAIGVVGL